MPRNVAKVQDLADKYPDTALAFPLDVTDDAQVTAAVGAAEDRFGGVDVLVNNAGYGYRAAIEEGEDDDVRQLFDTHVHGTVRTIKAVLPGMRARRSGTIVNLSSIGARICPEGSGYYSAVKAAVSPSRERRRQYSGPKITRIAAAGWRGRHAEVHDSAAGCAQHPDRLSALVALGGWY